MNRDQFLNLVKEHIAEDPEAAAHISDYVKAGLRSALNKANERAADMEIVASVLASRRYKGSDELVKSKLLKWRDKTALNWDWLLDKK